MKGRDEQAAEMLEALRALPLFSCLSELSLQLLASACRIRRVRKGEIIFFYLDPGQAAYLVLSGTISIVLNSPDG